MIVVKNIETLPDSRALLKAIGTVCSVIVDANELDSALSLGVKSVWHSISDVSEVVPVLDKGVDVAIIPFEIIESNDAANVAELFAGIPKSRLALSSAPSDRLKPYSNVFAYFINNLDEGMDSAGLNVLGDISKDLESCQGAIKRGQGIVLDASLLAKQEKQPLRTFVDLLFSTIKSDRQDGLVPTVVVDEQNVALGLCYSSKESVYEALRTGTGVYFSRTRGLWYKGATSGASQILQGISLDCDSDALRFSVTQVAPGFCHLETRSCWGHEAGISGLYQTLLQRAGSAPKGSYTARLFNDPELLRSKIMEEADELCTAKTKDEVAWEAADLLYFALVRCVAAGVELADIEKHLDKRAKKITRRPGNAKPQNGASQPPKHDAPLPDFEMKVFKSAELKPADQAKLLLRPIIKTDEIMDRVRPIVNQVRKGGDAAILELTKKFDRVEMDSVVIKAPFPQYLMKLDKNVKDAIDLAYSNIEKFHVTQMDESVLVVETMPGVKCSRFVRPIEKVGLYVPGGTAVLPSSTMMLGIPANVAGCKEIVIATPPRSDGSIAPEVAYVADKVGASLILKAGGAQAVAAMAYGTESVPKVDKICGPGNQYVTAAKMIAQSDSSALLAIDMPAGPSELLVVADKSANPAYVVSDLLSQAEHGVDSQVVLVAVGLSSDGLNDIQRELKRQASVLPRADIVKVSISKSYILFVPSMQDALNFSNAYAPEHLILNVENAESYLKDVMNAGSVFVGPWSPESCGDYASGTNHTLPTYGYSRMYSGVNTGTFVKHITSQTLTKDGLDAIGDCVTTLASVECLEAHRNAVAIRLADIRK